jgi:hypothetical protein
MPAGARYGDGLPLAQPTPILNRRRAAGVALNSIPLSAESDRGSRCRCLFRSAGTGRRSGRIETLLMLAVAGRERIDQAADGEDGTSTTTAHVPVEVSPRGRRGAGLGLSTLFIVIDAFYREANREPETFVPTKRP